MKLFITTTGLTQNLLGDVLSEMGLYNSCCIRGNGDGTSTREVVISDAHILAIFKRQIITEFNKKTNGIVPNPIIKEG